MSCAVFFSFVTKLMVEYSFDYYGKKFVLQYFISDVVNFYNH